MRRRELVGVLGPLGECLGVPVTHEARMLEVSRQLREQTMDFFGG